MKKLLFLPLLMITCICFAQNAQAIIGKPIKIGNLLVAQNDFPEQFGWEDAKKVCRALGKGWRLPTKSELNFLYENREKIGGFSRNTYWSLTGDDYRKSVCWDQSFAYGNQSYYSGKDVEVKQSVRAINAPLPIITSPGTLNKKIIGRPIKIGNLLVAQNDFPDAMNWDDAKAACTKLGSGWRLPNIKELKIIYNNQEKIGESSFKSSYYWSSIDTRYLFFGDGSWNTNYSLDLYVRAVKTL
jgi:hypothetical protein